jgi:hypothetical protein
MVARNRNAVWETSGCVSSGFHVKSFGQYSRNEGMDVLAFKANSTWHFRILVICFMKVVHSRIREVRDKFLHQITAHASVYLGVTTSVFSCTCHCNLQLLFKKNSNFIIMQNVANRSIREYEPFIYKRTSNFFLVFP